MIGQPRRAEFELVAHFIGEETWSQRLRDGWQVKKREKVQASSLLAEGLDDRCVARRGRGVERGTLERT